MQRTNPRYLGFWSKPYNGTERHFWIHSAPLCEPKTKLTPHLPTSWRANLGVPQCNKCKTKLEELEREYERTQRDLKWVEKDKNE